LPLPFCRKKAPGERLLKNTTVIAENTMGIKFEEAGRIGYMGHNGGFQFRQISDSEYEYKATIQDFHLNSGGITHGGFIMTLMDSGLGTSVYQSLGGEKKISTISLDVKFVAPSHEGDILFGSAKIIKKTRSMVFVRGELQVEGLVIATGDGIWKILTP
jgi:acyl-coenzyme A thioesterase PaaI-like protein